MASNLTIYGLIKNKPKSLNRQLSDLIKNRPEYTINEGAFENQAMAESQAFGRDRAIMGMENQIEQNTADALGQAQQATTSSSALLSTLGKLNESKNASLRGLATDEAAIQRDKLRDLYGANAALGEEMDKAWNFNVNEPYQNQIQAIRDKKKARQENLWKIIDTVTSAGTSLATGGLAK